MKKDKSDFEYYTDSHSEPEVFSFSESENEKQFLNENFVFNAEENSSQTGLDENIAAAGKEDNETEESKKTEKDNTRRDDHTSDIQSTTTSATTATTATSGAAAASSAGGAISAIASTAVIAVVVVVGGGIVMSEAFPQPNICEFAEVAAVDNSIQFMLKIGMDEESIYSEGEHEETDAIVDLSCPTNIDYNAEYPVGNFGLVVGEFSNLAWNTEYFLNVYRPTMLGADREYLLEESYSIWTPKKEVGPTPGPDIPADGIYLSEEKIAISVGEEHILTATIIPSDATDQSVTWYSTDNNVATVSEGIVFGVAEGEATIFATTSNGEFSAACSVTVLAKAIHTTAIELNKHELALEVNDNETLIATVYPEDSTDEISWESSEPSVVSVDSTGNVYAVTAGTSIVTVSSGEYYDTCTVTVTPKITHVTSVEIVYQDNVVTELTLDGKQSRQLEYRLYPGNATDQSVNWVSSDPSIVDFTQIRTYDCTIMGVSAGTATIRASSNSDPDIYAELVVTVNQVEANGIVFSEPETSIHVGDSKKLIPTINPYNATEKPYWSSSDSSIAAVDQDGTIHALNEGEVTITASVTAGTAGCTVYVLPEIQSISFPEDTTWISLDEYLPSDQVNVNANDLIATNPESSDLNISYESGDESIFTVDSDGTLHGLQEGVATLTANYLDKSATCSIEVVIPVTEITFDQTSISLAVDETYTINPTLTPSNATHQSPTYVYVQSGLSVVSVTDGVITALTTGTATVYVAYDYAYAYLDITVS